MDGKSRIPPNLVSPGEVRARREPWHLCYDGKAFDPTGDDITQHVQAVTHLPPALAHQVQNAYVYNDVVFKFSDAVLSAFPGTWRPQDRPSRGSDFLLRAEEALKHGAEEHEGQWFFLGSAGSSNYGHWLIDDLPRLSAYIEKHGNVGFSVMMSSFGEKIDEIKTEALGIYDCISQIRFIDRHKINRIQEAIIVDPISIHPVLKSRRSLALLRRDVRKAFPTSEVSSTKRIFVGRPMRDARSIINGVQIKETMEHCGFTSVAPETMSFAEQYRCFRDAEIVVGIMGAAMTNVTFCSPRTPCIFLAPDGWHEPFYWDLCDTLELTYYRLRGRVFDTQRASSESSRFLIDPEGLAVLVEAALRRKEAGIHF